MSFRKPYHMPFRKLVPPFTLTGFNVNDGLLCARILRKHDYLKTFLSWKLDKFTLFTHFRVGWNLEKI